MEDWNDLYRFDGEDAESFSETVPRYVCDKCGNEILGDREVEIVEGVGVDAK